MSTTSTANHSFLTSSEPLESLNALRIIYWVKRKKRLHTSIITHIELLKKQIADEEIKYANGVKKKSLEAEAEVESETEAQAETNTNMDAV